MAGLWAPGLSEEMEWEWSLDSININLLRNHKRFLEVRSLQKVLFTLAVPVCPLGRTFPPHRREGLEFLLLHMIVQKWHK